MNKRDRTPGGPSPLGIHARVWLRAAVFGLGAYGCIHLLIYAVNFLKGL